MKIVKKRRTSSKPKKVTIKFFLNKAVQPEVSGRIKRYPLYMLITYDRKNTMLRSHYGKYYKDLNEIEKNHYPGLLKMEERIIRKTIDNELLKKGSGFLLKGIHKKYEQYSFAINILLQNYLKGQLWSILLRLEPFEFAKALNFNDPDIEFDTLYRMSKKLYKDLMTLVPKSFEQEIEIYGVFMKLYQGSFFNYTFPTVIEWIDSSAREDYKLKLKEYYPQNDSLINKSIAFVDQMVERMLEHYHT